MKQWQSIIQHIEQTTGQVFSVRQQQSLAGGSINNAFLLTGDNGEQHFVKTNQTGRKDMFEAEAKGLLEMSSSKTIKVPKPVCFGDDGVHSYIVMEYLDLAGQANQSLLGEQLAAMHRVTTEQFGWNIHNTIGATHQSNTWQDNWLDFWREQRLGYQLRLAAENGYGGELQSLGEKLLIEMPKLFTGREVKPSMLHGDLWGGNVAGLKDGTPVIYDPAFYYGDREADLAMTYVFGGFGPDFYASYQDAFPLDDGFFVRKTFYNIYHIINHLNMFGGGYHSQSVNMLEQVLAEIN
ncbi:MAG: fructosamine kinase family protein [Gammaproteobacteria bacterium]|nr:fructosamine kinase family protein [Gammaproteobacteria bacterium]